jgi:hypothetical protein
LQHLLKRDGGIKIRGLWDRRTIFQAMQFATLFRERKTRCRAMVFEDKRGRGEQRRGENENKSDSA